MDEELRFHLERKVEAFSAGSRPSGRVNPRAVEAMREVGYDLTTHDSKGLDEFNGQDVDVESLAKAGRALNEARRVVYGVAPGIRTIMSGRMRRNARASFRNAVTRYTSGAAPVSGRSPARYDDMAPDTSRDLGNPDP